MLGIAALLRVEFVSPCVLAKMESLRRVMIVLEAKSVNHATMDTLGHLALRNRFVHVIMELQRCIQSAKAVVFNVFHATMDGWEIYVINLFQCVRALMEWPRNIQIVQRPESSVR